ncbi:hypothetical protein ACIA5G_35925 [Amycolatopsis sp. NPDC051758]|uniref:hypothetical protein n=1 Tax=Amycolatopsis sp. NPDC051758 TaxID=3363935 RepID=UPI0037A2990D
MRRKHCEAAAYGLGVLDDAEEFEEHLRGCARCRVRVAEFRSVTGALARAARLGYLPLRGPGGPGPGAFAEAGHPAPEGLPDRAGVTGGSPDGGVAGSGYPAPADGAARRRKPCVFTGRRGSAAGALLLLAVAETALGAARPATGEIGSASAACIVSPAQVVAGTACDLRDLPWSAGFQ